MSAAGWWRRTPRRATSWCRCAPASRSAISPPTDRACASGWPPAATPAASSRPPCRCAATTARWSTCASRRPRSPTARPATTPVALLLRFRSRASGAQEQALHIAEARYRELFSNAVHGICRCHVDGTILEGNPALAAMLGHASPESLVGVKLADIYEEPDAFLTLVDRIRHAGRVLSVDANWRRRNGDPLGGPALGALRDGRQPGRRHRAAGRGRDRAPDARGAARAHDQDGVDRPPRRRHRARLQQPADGDPRLRRPDAGLAQRAGSDRPARAPDPPLGRARQPADAPAPRLQPQAVPPAAHHRPERRGRGEQPDAAPADLGAHRAVGVASIPGCCGSRSTRRSCSRCC